MLHSAGQGDQSFGGSPTADLAAAGCGAAGRSRRHYLDADAFTKLFRRRRDNHDAICNGLRLIVRGVAVKIRYATADEYNDQVADALLWMIERIDRFKFSRGNNAFSYFSRLAWNILIRQRSRAQAVRFFSDVDGDEDADASEIDRAVPYFYAAG